jgi:uncharacterized membrane protein
MSPMEILKKSFAISFYLNLIYYALGLIAYVLGIPGLTYIFLPHAFAALYLIEPEPGSYPFFQYCGLLLFAFLLTTGVLTVLLFLFIFLVREYKQRQQ